MEALRRHLGTVVAVALTAALTAATPAIATGVRSALFADDSDKVDGKDAVGFTASVEDRKGKLVATSGMTGRLPNSIIAKAPNADLLDGRDSSEFLGATAKAADADTLDGMDSTSFVRGNGEVLRGADAFPPGSTGRVWGRPLGNFPSPDVAIYFTCPDDLAQTGLVEFVNGGSETINVFSDNGGSNPNVYQQLAGDSSFTQSTAATGEHITFQVQGAGMATIEFFSVHRASDCHAQAQGVFSFP